MIRKLGGIAVGTAIAILIMMMAEAAGHRLFDLPIGPDGETVVAVERLPVGVQLSVGAGWFLGPLIGGYASTCMSRFGWTAWAVAGIIAFTILVYVILAPLPLWMTAGGAAAALLGGWLAQLPPRRYL